MNREQELRVVAAILAATDDPRSAQLYEQFGRSRRLVRNEYPEGFDVAPAGTSPDLAVELDEDVTSPWITVHDRDSGQPLEFRITLRRGGYFGTLEGRAPGGSWPRTWRVDMVELAREALGALRLPAATTERGDP